MNEYERHISNNKNKSYYDDDIIICTPGRLLHLLDKKIINVSELKLLVMDEADEMLSRGFLDDIKKIFNYLPDGETTKISLFSATIP
jgi:ATP-dependent RNA helicase RhlE